MEKTKKLLYNMFFFLFFLFFGGVGGWGAQGFKICLEDKTCLEKHQKIITRNISQIDFFLDNGKILLSVFSKCENLIT